MYVFLVFCLNLHGFTWFYMVLQDFCMIFIYFCSMRKGSKNIKYLEKNTENKYSMRVSVPDFKREKFENVVLYVLNNCAGKPNVGETVLYKLLYFLDFNYYELYEEQLTGATYIKLPHGPAPKEFKSIVNSMIENKKLRRIKTKYHNYPQTRYIPLVDYDLTPLKATEKQVIDNVIAKLSCLTASSISEYSHKDMPWLASKEGEKINYELAFYRELPYSVRDYEEPE